MSDERGIEAMVRIRFEEGQSDLEMVALLRDAGYDVRQWCVAEAPEFESIPLSEVYHVVFDLLARFKERVA